MAIENGLCQQVKMSQNYLFLCHCQLRRSTRAATFCLANCVCVYCQHTLSYVIILEEILRSSGILTSKIVLYRWYIKKNIWVIHKCERKWFKYIKTCWPWILFTPETLLFTPTFLQFRGWEGQNYQLFFLTGGGYLKGGYIYKNLSFNSHSFMATKRETNFWVFTRRRRRQWIKILTFFPPIPPEYNYNCTRHHQHNQDHLYHHPSWYH